MKKRLVYLVSPREPSGATWLINCFLDLGIKTFRYSPLGMWERTPLGEYVLKPNEYLLKRWLPALSDYDKFQFRGDIEVRWMHEWPTEKEHKGEVIYFVRDPRDALYSRYKRENPRQTFLEFLRTPDHQTLLHKAVNWRIYTETWLSANDLRVVKFEGYKKDAFVTLSDTLSWMGLEFDDGAISRAVENSTYERAALAEKKYIAENKEDTEIINRSGTAGEWKTTGEENEAFREIAALSASVLRKLGYSVDEENVNDESGKIQVQNLHFFRDSREFMPGYLSSPINESDVNEFCMAIKAGSLAVSNRRFLDNASMSETEKRVFLQSVSEAASYLSSSAQTASLKYSEVAGKTFFSGLIPKIRKSLF